MKNLNIIAVSLFTATMAFSTGALAQQAQQGQQPPPQPEAATNVSDAELESFVDARQSIVEIQSEYSEKLQGAEDPEKANELQQEANEEMIGAVQEAGLDVDSFNSIAMAIQNDPKLQERMQDFMEQ